MWGPKQEKMQKPRVLRFQHAGVIRKSVVYETGCRHAAVQRGKQDQNIYSSVEYAQYGVMLNVMLWNVKCNVE